MEDLTNNSVDEQQEIQGQDEQELEQSQQGTPEEQGKEPEFTLDKDGNFAWNTSEYEEKYKEEDSEPEQEEEQPETDTEGDDTSDQEEEPKFKVKVDGEEIEVTQDELLRGYMRQRDYTQKTHQWAEQRKQFEQYQPQQQYQQPQQENYQQRSNQQPSADLNAMAKDIAARQLGLDSADDLSELDFNHITAVVEAKQALLNQRNSMMTRQQNIDNLEAQLRSEEPRYDDIMRNIGDTIQNLPVSRYQKLQKAYNEGNPEPLRELFKEMQKEYYAKSIQKVEQKKKPTVPVVEHATNTPVVPTKRGKKIDYAAFGKMDTEQKSKILLDLGLLD